MSHFYYALQDNQEQAVKLPAAGGATESDCAFFFETNPASGSPPLKSRAHGRARPERHEIEDGKSVEHTPKPYRSPLKGRLRSCEEP